MDEEILYRCFDSITEPYSQDFVDEYIGKSIIEQYKQTELYVLTRDSFLEAEKKNEATFDVMKFQYIDTKRIADISKQLHLLCTDDIACVILSSVCMKVVKIYCGNGLIMYTTDRKSNRKQMSWSGADFMRFSKANNPINQPYDEAFISIFRFLDRQYFIEHNETLNAEEVEKIKQTVVSELSKIRLYTQNGNDT